MKLWPDEYEALRAEAQTLAPLVVDALALPPVDGDRAARIAQRRASLQQHMVLSPDAVDEVIAGVPCRVIRHPEPRATYLHFHGGAMLYGSPLMNDVDNAEKSQRHGVTVVSVDYRLAPEHPFPAGPDDCVAVAAALLEDPDIRLLIAGESAGATHAATTVLRVRDELDAIDRVLGCNLVFGLYDFSATPSLRGVRPTDVPDIIADDEHDEILDCYLPSLTREELRDARYSPLYADLRNLPPALFTVGTADHLLDDSLFMAARWAAFGNECELAVYPDGIHAFVGFPMALADRARERIDQFLEGCLK
jgi:acetyl esterase/lipase